MAVVLDTGAVSGGSGNTGSNRERDIRKQFVEHDLVEAVLLMPENLFYNTTAPGIILVIRRGGPGARPHAGQILLINASKEFAKGKPKNYLAEENIVRIADAYLDWREVEKLSKVIAVDEAIRNDYNLSPSRYVAVDGTEEVLPVEEAMVLLAEAEEERQASDAEISFLLANLGLKAGIKAQRHVLPETCAGCDRIGCSGGKVYFG